MKVIVCHGFLLERVFHEKFGVCILMVALYKFLCSFMHLKFKNLKY